MLAEVFCLILHFSLVVFTLMRLDVLHITLLATSRLKRSFNQKHFRHTEASIWWNSLPSSLFQDIDMFRYGLFTHLLQETVT